MLLFIFWNKGSIINSPNHCYQVKAIVDIHDIKMYAFVYAPSSRLPTNAASFNANKTLITNRNYVPSQMQEFRNRSIKHNFFLSELYQVSLEDNPHQANFLQFFFTRGLSLGSTRPKWTIISKTIQRYIFSL